MDDFQAEFERLVQLDQEWRDHFAQTNTPIRSSAEEEESGSSCSIPWWRRTSLARDAVGTGARHAVDRESQWPIAELLIGNIDEYGYLNATVEELAASTEFRRKRSPKS